jgi:transcriptional regulator with XRE-family HTH domain
MTITSEQVTAARKLLGWNQLRLAIEAGVSESTARRFEGPEWAPWGAHVAAITKALTDAGVEFTKGGVTLRKEKAGP